MGKDNFAQGCWAPVKEQIAVPAVGGVAAWRRSKGGQLLPGAAESETGAKAPSCWKGWWSCAEAAGTNSPESCDYAAESPSHASAEESF